MLCWGTLTLVLRTQTSREHLSDPSLATCATSTLLMVPATAGLQTAFLRFSTSFHYIWLPIVQFTPAKAGFLNLFCLSRWTKSIPRMLHGWRQPSPASGATILAARPSSVHSCSVCWTSLLFRNSHLRSPAGAWKDEQRLPTVSTLNFSGRPCSLAMSIEFLLKKDEQ